MIVSLCAFGIACSDDGGPSGDSTDRCPTGASYDSQLGRCVSDTLQPDASTDSDDYTDTSDGGQSTPDTNTPDTNTPDSGTPDTSTPDTTYPQDSGDEDTGPQCSGSELFCGGQCVDPMTSADHCDGCNNPCPAPRSCQGGTCQCPSGTQWCGGDCVDTSSSDAHCGDCDDPCQGGYVCSESQCHENEKIAGIIQALNTHRSTDSNCGTYGDYSAVNPVQGDPHLHQAAQRHADDMASNNFFDHTGSDGSSFSQRIYDTNYSGSPVGENIAAGGSVPANIVQRWMDSDGHCRNNMNGSATHVGVGYAYDSSSRYGSYWVLKLAR